MNNFKRVLKEMSPVKHAMSIAHDKHFYQRRKFNMEPYSMHPKRVRNTVSLYTKDKDLIIAASLHDTVEDTKTSYEEIDAVFGGKVASLVKELTTDVNVTKASKPKILLTKLMKMSSDALLIKLADRLDNVSDFPTAPPKFVKRYTEETKYILDNLNRPLNSNHKKLINEIRSKL